MYSITVEQKKKLIEAKNKVDKACEINDNTLENLCNMMDLKITAYRSTSGIIKIIKGTNDKVLKIDINGIQYENIETMYEYKENWLKEESIQSLKFYLIKDIGKLLVTVQDFAFILFEQNIDELTYLIKANIQTTLSIDTIYNILRRNKNTTLGNIVNDNDSRVCILYNKQIYVVNKALKFEGKTALLIHTDTGRTLFVSEDTQVDVYVDNKIIESERVDRYAMTIYKLTDTVYRTFRTLLDIKHNKIVKINRGCWDNYKVVDRKANIEEVSERYFVCTNTEYIGVIIDSDVAIYDYQESKVYWSQGERDKYRDTEGNIFNGFATSGSGCDEPFEMEEYRYSYKKITKEEVLTELMNYKVG